MKTPFDINVLPPAGRLQYRLQTARYRADRLRSWRASFKQTRKMGPLNDVLHREAVEQAHRPCVLMNVVGLPLWKN